MSATAPTLTPETVALMERLDTAEETFQSLRHVGTFWGPNLSAVAVRADGLRIVEEVRAREALRSRWSGRDAVTLDRQTRDLDDRDELLRWQTLDDLQARAEELLFEIVFPDMERRASGLPLFAETEPRWSDDRILGPTYVEAEGDGSVEPMSAEHVALYEGVSVGRVLRLREADANWMPTGDRSPVDHKVWDPSQEGVQAARKQERFVLSPSVLLPEPYAEDPVAVRPSLDGARDLGIRTMRHDAADAPLYKIERPPTKRQRLVALAQWGDHFLREAKLLPTGLEKDQAPGGSHPHDRDEEGCRERFHGVVVEHGLKPHQLKVRRGRGNRTDPRLIEVLGQLRRDGFDLRDIAVVAKVGKRTLERHIGGIKPDHKTPEDEPPETALSEPYALRTRLDGGPWLPAWKGSNWAEEQREIGREIAVLRDGGTPGRPVKPKLKAPAQNGGNEVSIGLEDLLTGDRH